MKNMTMNGNEETKTESGKPKPPPGAIRDPLMRGEAPPSRPAVLRRVALTGMCLFTLGLPAAGFLMHPALGCLCTAAIGLFLACPALYRYCPSCGKPAENPSDRPDRKG